MTATIDLDRQKSTRPTRVTREAQESKRSKGEDVVPARGHKMNHVPQDVRTINGWGADLDPADRPAVPMEWPSDVMTARGDVKHWQEPIVKIYRSNEMPNLTPVFGESSPPHGLSERIRDEAYQWGEGMARHWMLLMLADRVETYASFFGSLFTGQYFREKAWGTVWRLGTPHQKRRMVATAVTVPLIAALVVFGIVKAVTD